MKPKMLDYADWKEADDQDKADLELIPRGFAGYTPFADVPKKLGITKQACWNAIKRGTLSAKVIPITEKVSLVYVHQSAINQYKRRQKFFNSEANQAAQKAPKR